jgi:hypothetical protein
VIVIVWYFDLQLCYQCILLLKLWVRFPFITRYYQYNIMWYSLSVTCNMSVDFSGYSCVILQLSWPPRYKRNIVESGVKHHKSNQPYYITRWRMCTISYSIPRWRTAISCGQCRSSNMIYYAEMHRQTVE